MRKIFLSIVFVLGALGVNATNYYAAPNATGSGTSYDQPAELLTAITKLASGDTLFLLDGFSPPAPSGNVASQ